jgi:radical SAM protein with 4Fe4S-binding SPASM domain
MIAFYLKQTEKRLQQGFLEIVKWVRRLCPNDPITLFYHPAGEANLAGLGDIEALPVQAVLSGEGNALPEAIATRLSNISPLLVQWGPDPVVEPVERTLTGSKPISVFSSHLRFHRDSTGTQNGSGFTFIHGDPNPAEPRLRDTMAEGEDGIFTGSIPIEEEEQNRIWPLHSRGAEITANLVKNILRGTPVSSCAYLYPVIAMIEPTRRCNLTCPMCPVGNQTATHGQEISFEHFQKIISEVAPFLIHLTLHNYGESFLHHDIYAMIAHAKAEGIPDVNISTNGHFLDATHLIDSGLDEIMISLDGITQEIYAAYRRGGRIEKVIQNIRALVREKIKRQAEKPRVELQFIIMKHNQHQMEEFRLLAKDLAVDRVRFKTFNLQMSGSDVCDTGLEFLPIQRELTRYNDDQGRILKTSLQARRCKWPWERVVIQSDGQVVPCCNDFNGSYAMGNVFEQPFHDIWFGAKYNQFRKTMLKKWRGIPLCTDCPVPSLADLSFERVESTPN